MTTPVCISQAFMDSFHAHHAQLLGKRVWLACSGGRDSLGLALLCRTLFDQGRLPFLPQLIHVNHGMQAANDQWAQQVAQWAQQHDMACQIIGLNLTHKSEQTARDGRYQAMMQLMNQDDVLILGHHQDDQVETLLMRLFNGAGVTGLGAMREWTSKQAHTAQSPSDVNKPRQRIFLWRPWLEISRAQITEYAQRHNLKYIDDPTNVAQSPSKLALQTLNDRAWLRSVLLPHITERYPQASEAMARTAQLMQQASDSIDEQVTQDLAQVALAATEQQSVIALDKLAGLSAPRQAALIHHWLAPYPNQLPPSKRLVDEVLALSFRQDSNHQTCLYFDAGSEQYQVRRYQNKLYRLQHAYAQWLQMMPHQIHLPLAHNAEELSLNLADTDVLSLKQSGLEFDWQLTGVRGLMAHLARLLNSADAKVTPSELIFEPLPRTIKLALAGRSGRKSGKKLLQALDQPSFMRGSVVLCRLDMMGSDGILQDSSTAVPLFIICIDRIWVLQSQFTALINQLLATEVLSTQILEC